MKEHGEAMWVLRRREDIIFSPKWAREQLNFEENVLKFIKATYKTDE